MVDPIFWLGLSFLLVAVSLTAVLLVALPALQELARAARSAEKLFDTLSRELPPTLEAIRLTGMEISDLTDDVSEGVQSAGQVVKQVDQSIRGAKKQAQRAQTTTRSMFVGVKTAWKTFRKPHRRVDQLPPSAREPLDFEEGYSSRNAAPQRRAYREEYLEEWEDDRTPEEREPIAYQRSNQGADISPDWEEDNSEEQAQLDPSYDSSFEQRHQHPES